MSAVDLKLEVDAADRGDDLRRQSSAILQLISDRNSLGFYNAGDRIKFWGARSAFWGGLWGLFLGGLASFGHDVVPCLP
jgi:hypothetical protein